MVIQKITSWSLVERYEKARRTCCLHLVHENGGSEFLRKVGTSKPSYPTSHHGRPQSWPLTTMMNSTLTSCNNTQCTPRRTIYSSQTARDNDALSIPVLSLGNLWQTVGTVTRCAPRIFDWRRGSTLSLYEFCFILKIMLYKSCRIQGVPGEMDKTSEECSLCWTIPI